MTDHRTLVAEHLDVAKRAHNAEMAQTHVAIAQVHATMAQTEILRTQAVIAAIRQFGGEDKTWPLAIREGLEL